MSEQRLIYANELLDLFYVAAVGQDKQFVKTVEMVVSDTPTVDAVPVVRCKDCKHYEHFAIDSDPEFDYCSLTGIDRGDEDYCSDAERRGD